jgi:hypothetical protein
MRYRTKHRQIAPRLASGEKRVNAGNGLPPIVKHALTVIAEHERQSRSWVIEQILLQWAKSDPRLHRMLSKGAVEYVPRKTPVEPDDSKSRSSSSA